MKLPHLERRPELDALRGLFLVWMTLTHLPTRFSDFAVVLALGVLVLGAARLAPRRWPAPALWLGEISYSIYMVQALLLGTLGRAMQVAMPHLPLALRLALLPLLAAALIVAAALMYRLVELPARQWLRARIEPGRTPATKDGVPAFASQSEGR